MHGRGPRRIVGAGAAGEGGAQAGLTEPAPQAACGGQGRVGEMAGQDNPDQVGAPLRVFLAQGQGLLQQRGRGVGPRRGTVIRRGRSLSVRVEAASEHVVDGAQRQVKTLGQQRGGEAALMAKADRLADRRRNGAWHGRRLQKDTSETIRAHRR